MSKDAAHCAEIVLQQFNFPFPTAFFFIIEKKFERPLFCGFCWGRSPFYQRKNWEQINLPSSESIFVQKPTRSNLTSSEYFMELSITAALCLYPLFVIPMRAASFVVDAISGFSLSIWITLFSVSSVSCVAFS